MAHKVEDVPKVIFSAVKKEPEKSFLLNLEKELITFIKTHTSSKKGSSYTISSKSLRNSYYRLLGHQLCQYYHLQHRNNNTNQIIVSLRNDGFDYERFIELFESKNEKDFVRLQDFITWKTDINTWHPGVYSKNAAKNRKSKTKRSKDGEAEDKVGSGASSSNSLSEASKDTDESIDSLSRITPPSSPTPDSINDSAHKQPQASEEHKQGLDVGSFDELDHEDSSSISSGVSVRGEKSNRERLVDVERSNKSNRNYANNYHHDYVPYYYPPYPMQVPINMGAMQHVYHPPPGSYYSGPPNLAYSPSFYPVPYPGYLYNVDPRMQFSYDHETERKILNNPYIILPGPPKERKNKHNRKYVKELKPYASQNNEY